MSGNELEQIIAAGSQSFARAARLFDPATRIDALRLYAWCRTCDDRIDGQTLGHARQSLSNEERQARLVQLRRQTDSALRGEPQTELAFQALTTVAQRHALPAQWVHDVLDGFALDVAGATYATLPDTLRYCYHVAGAVGLLMARIMGVSDADTLDRACDLGLAFQLTNIARDLVEDARAGHLYAPADLVAAHNLTLDQIAANDPRIVALAQALVRLAAPYYASARCGAYRLPLRAAWAIHAAGLIYRDIGAVLLQSETMPQRARTGAARKILRVAQAGLLALYGRFIGRYRPAPARAGLWQRPY